MKTHGVPETFWFVVSPTLDSELGDICFECDFQRFAQQIRGGLDERTIVGIFADHAEALGLAEKLLKALKLATDKPEVRLHKSPWSEWYATQESLEGVCIVNKATGEKVVVEPPMEWGHRWVWNFSEDGTGIIIIRRT